ncbi:class I SAM-dependent methyltransferase [Stieleria sp. JC731]|uniref:class I SAM-dependent methyltransferase n=1 Tax=Pirellulaceae TaxID=2691357 RepID=UPI001E639DF8|nr:methyltransferase domain-containing protein [Stieleria sp. JC731]MCC9599447.1 class I SAM-dependent methyltransferase [Stieleria sp. JC731]
MSQSRFAFGDNWQAYLRFVDQSRIDEACQSLIKLLGLADSPQDLPTDLPLAGQSFLDIGSGSGLFSLAAWRLGASVTSIDYDRQSVACTEQLREREIGPTVDPGQQAEDASQPAGAEQIGAEQIRAGQSGAEQGSEGQGRPERDSDRRQTWRIMQGSVLDREWLESLGQHDLVYSWGVLHHTGAMDDAIRCASNQVRPGGILAIAIYNDQGGASRRWLAIKQTYHKLPAWMRPAWVVGIASVYELKFALARLVRGRNPLPFSDWKKKKYDRGMSAWYDWVDWIGGMPFEVATVERIVVPLERKGFQLINLRTVGSGWGCNEFVFRRSGQSMASWDKPIEA